MNRRDFIQTIVALSVSQILGACHFSRRSVPIPEIPPGQVVIDVHAHTFNAADLPVDGFIKYVALSNVKIPDVDTLAAILIHAIADVGAPRFDQEHTRLETLLGQKSLLLKEQKNWEREDKQREDKYRNAVNNAINNIQKQAVMKTAGTSEQAFMQSLYNEFSINAKSAVPVDWYSLSEKGVGVIPRYIVWGAKLLRYRYQQIEDIRETYGHVDLFATTLVDFDLWFADGTNNNAEQKMLLATRVTIEQQMELMRLIARWSGGLVHPYVAYDPRRDVEKGGQALACVKKAIEEQGAIGVKLYPPMGFVALGNKGLEFCNSPDRKFGEKLDEALKGLYRYCEHQEIPLIAHMANSNYNGRCEPYKGRAHPKYWAEVLKIFPKLRLNFGHFGTHELPGGEWSRIMRGLMLDYEHVYADLSHVEEFNDSSYVQKFFVGLDEFFGQEPKNRKLLQQRILYGSDWIMLAKETIGKSYFNEVVGEYGNHMGKPARDQFVGENSVRFLGLASSKNRDRLMKFYRASNMQVPRWMQNVV